MPNECSDAKTNVVQAEASSVSGTICQRRPDSITPLIGKPVIKRSSGQKATRLVNKDSNAIESTPISLRRAARKRKRVPVCGISSLADNEGGDRKLQKTSGNICADCLSTSARNQLGEVEKLQQCTGDCGVSLHPSCLAIKCGPLASLLPRGFRWFCQDCRTCSAFPTCSVTERTMYLLNCDTCDRGYHLKCLQPPAAVAGAKTKSAWRCSFCIDHHDTAISSKVECKDGKKLSLKTQSLISNCHKRDCPNTVKNENINELDNGKDLNSSKDVVKKQDIGLGNRIVHLDMMPNSNNKKNIVQTKADSVSSVIRNHRLEIPSLICRIPVSKLSSALFLKLDSNQITPLSLPRAGGKRKKPLTEPSDKNVKKEEKLGKPSISGSTYLRYVTEDGKATSAPYIKKEKLGKPSISGSTYLRYATEDSKATSATYIKKEKLGKPTISGSMYQRDFKKDCNVPLSLPRAAGRKRKRELSETSNKKLKKEKHEKLSIVGTTYQNDATEDVLENMNRPVSSDLPSGVVNEDIKICKGTRTLENNSTIQTPVICPAVIKFGKFEVNTCYSCPFPLAEKTPILMFCEFCLKYTKCQSILERHMRHCNWRSPPGTEIYRSGDLSVFEVDGNVDKTYCQTLCRVGKLFLYHKFLDIDVEPFLFYIVTKNDGFGCHLVGYFSKLKNNEDNNNVACIVTMPQYRRKGYGRFLIELSYLLSRIEKQPGTPEKPFSSSGELLYCAYWKGVILEYFDKHRGVENININDISSETGLIREDIIDTLQSLNMVVEIYNQITICIDWSIVDGHIKKKNELKQIHIEPDRLRWTPSNVLCSPDGKGSQRLEEPFIIKCIS